MSSAIDSAASTPLVRRSLFQAHEDSPPSNGESKDGRMVADQAKQMGQAQAPLAKRPSTSSSSPLKTSVAEAAGVARHEAKEEAERRAAVLSFAGVSVSHSHDRALPDRDLLHALTFGRMRRRELWRAWISWAEPSRERARLRRIMRASLRRLIRPRLATCYAHWRMDWESAAREFAAAQWEAAALDAVEMAQAKAAEETAAARAEARAAETKAAAQAHRARLDAVEAAREVGGPTPSVVELARCGFGGETCGGEGSRGDGTRSGSSGRSGEPTEGAARASPIGARRGDRRQGGCRTSGG